MLSRQSWKALLIEQGFDDVQAAGESNAVPPLLSRQSVVLGVSNGSVLLVKTQKKADIKGRQSAPTAMPMQQARPEGRQSADVLVSVKQVWETFFVTHFTPKEYTQNFLYGY